MIHASSVFQYLAAKARLVFCRFRDRGALATDVRDRHTFAFDGHYNARGAERITETLTDLSRAPAPGLRTE